MARGPASRVEQRLEGGAALHSPPERRVERREARGPAARERHREQCGRRASVERGKGRRNGGDHLVKPRDGAHAVPMRTFERRAQRGIAFAPHDAVRKRGGVERMGARAHEERQEGGQFRAPVAHRRGGEQQHATARYEPGESRVSRGRGIADMVGFIDDHEPAAAGHLRVIPLIGRRRGLCAAPSVEACGAPAECFERHERRRDAGRRHGGAPHRPERRRRDDDRAPGLPRERERHERLAEAGLVREERTSHALDARADASHRVQLVRAQRDRAKRGRATGRAVVRISKDGARDRVAHRGQRRHQVSNGSMSTGRTRYARRAASVSVAASGTSPSIASRASGARTETARDQSAGMGSRASVQPR